MIPTDALSARERELLSLMAVGYSNAAIATALVLSTKTVETHVGSIYAKLDLPLRDDGVHRRVQAVLLFLQATDALQPQRPALRRVA